MKFAGIIFDFDGVLLESEHLGNVQLADYLTRLGHDTTPEYAMAHYMGLKAHVKQRKYLVLIHI